jgi:hypothetical protein
VIRGAATTADGFCSHPVKELYISLTSLCSERFYRASSIMTRMGSHTAGFDICGNPRASSRGKMVGGVRKVREWHEYPEARRLKNEISDSCLREAI